MKVELSLKQLAVINSWAEFTKSESDLTVWTSKDDLVHSIIEDAIEQAEELEEVDLNDCGDSCKL